MQPVKRLIAADLQQRIRDMKRVPLQASVSLKPGHDYWWFQEFGTGSRGSEAAAYGLGPDDFTRPASVAKHQRGGITYEIHPKKKKKLFFYWKVLQDWVFVPGGGIAKGASGQRKGHSWAPITTPYVMHPGVRRTAFLRRTLWAFRNDVRLALIAMARRKQRPVREEIAEMLNRRLIQLKIMLEQNTPRYVQPPPPEGFSPSATGRHDDPQGMPLAEAWDVELFDLTWTSRSHTKR